MKKTAIALFMLSSHWGAACEACQRQQPKITRGLTHGAGPTSDWDWLIVAIAFLILLLSFILTLKYLIKPGEKMRNHIKYFILNQSHE